MTSTPRKLTVLTNNEREKGDGSKQITSFAAMLTVFNKDTRFEEFNFSIVSDHVALLETEISTLMFMSQEAWGSETKYNEYLEQFSKKNITLICCGNEEDFSQVSEDISHPFVHFTVFPISLTTLSFQVRSLFRTENFHEKLNQEKFEIDETLKNIKHVLSISRELNGTRDVNKLLDLILEKALSVTGSDAGSIYVVDGAKATTDEQVLIFKICHNASVELNLTEFRMPINEQSIVGNSVLHNTSINIPDLYKLDADPKKNPYNAKHDVSWDQRNNYECHSMLSVPMFDISHTVIGVIQLINKKVGARPLTSSVDFQERVLPYDETSIEYAEIVAHQAGIALENALLTEEKEKLFDGFVDASVKAIEQRDPSTSGHSHRVAKLTLKMAELVNGIPNGLFGSTFFNESQLKEIEYASLLHDFGKLGVREQVLLKAKKLYPWQMDLLQERFELIRARFEIEYLKDKVKYLDTPNMFPPGLGPDHFKEKFDSQVADLSEYLDFILQANEPTVLEKKGFDRLKDIANFNFSDSKTEQRPFLLSDELKALSISRGSLTSEEFSEIQSHVTHTFEFLRKIPWGRELANVPHIAAKHHEKLDGSGYPTSAAASEIPYQTRIMTISDIFDALTASDRPYKKAVPLDRALDIIDMEVKAGKCDADLFKLFIESKAYEIVI